MAPSQPIGTLASLDFMDYVRPDWILQLHAPLTESKAVGRPCPTCGFPVDIDSGMCWGCEVG